MGKSDAEDISTRRRSRSVRTKAGLSLRGAHGGGVSPDQEGLHRRQARQPRPSCFVWIPRSQCVSKGLGVRAQPLPSGTGLGRDTEEENKERWTQTEKGSRRQHPGTWLPLPVSGLLGLFAATVREGVPHLSPSRHPSHMGNPLL